MRAEACAIARDCDPLAAPMLDVQKFRCCRSGEGHMRITTFGRKARLLLALGGLIGATLIAGAADAATVVALGASNTYGKGVARNQSYPAQLEALLRAQGYNVRIVNAGINGDTTGGMLARLNRVVPKGTAAVLLQPGGNDRRKGAGDQTAEIESQLSARGVRVIMVPNTMFRGKPHQPDGQHLTPEGYHMLAEDLVSQVAGAVGR
jgi:acyl-CoA thioesterase-1